MDAHNLYSPKEADVTKNYFSRSKCLENLYYQTLRLLTMCLKDDPVKCTWSCGHRELHILGPEIIWCTEASRRGRLCANIEPSDKEQVRNWAATHVCPNCRPRRASGMSRDGNYGGAEDEGNHDEEPGPRRRLGSVGPSGIITGV